MNAKIAFLCLIAGFSFCAVAQEDIVAEGIGEGISRDEALLGAKRNAVEKGIGTILLSQTEIENFMVKKDQILTKTVGTVKNYEVIAETKTTDHLFEIKIKAVLSKTALHDDLAAFQILIESMDKPRIMILIDENNIGNSEPTNNAAETALLGFLKDPYEFDCIDPSIAQNIRASLEKMAQLTGNPVAAASLGAKNGAEVLVIGKAISRKADGVSADLGGMISVQADLTLKAINCATGRIIGAADAHAARIHISPATAGNQAIAKAAIDCGKKMLDAIIKDWQSQTNNGMSISLVINKVATFKIKKDVVQSLESLPGVTAAHERSWDSEGKTLMVDIQYKGTVSGFCEKADDRKLRSGGGSLNVSGVQGAQVTLTAQVL